MFGFVAVAYVAGFAVLCACAPTAMFAKAARHAWLAGALAGFAAMCWPAAYMLALAWCGVPAALLALCGVVAAVGAVVMARYGRALFGNAPAMRTGRARRVA